MKSMTKTQNQNATGTLKRSAKSGQFVRQTDAKKGAVVTETLTRKAIKKTSKRYAVALASLAKR